MFDSKKDVVGDNRSVSAPDIIHHVEQALIQSPRKYLKPVFQQLTFEASPAYRTILEDVKTGASF
jgi:hypothetical protein